jgi:hypothetical protein
MVPKIEVLFIGKNENNESVYTANCPIDECQWSDISTDFEGLEADADAHEQWHAEGRPE